MNDGKINHDVRNDVATNISYPPQLEWVLGQFLAACENSDDVKILREADIIIQELLDCAAGTGRIEHSGMLVLTIGKAVQALIRREQGVSDDERV